MRVALVHECIAGFHGSERVLAALAELYPDAPIYSLIHQRRATRGTVLAQRDHRTSFLDRLPLLRDRHRLLLPLMPYAVEQHDLRGFDVVISSHHTAAHGVLTRADQLHVCYSHSPARYAWDLYHEHLPPGRAAPLRRYMLHRFRRWDAVAGLRPDVYIANSHHVARRIARTYRRDAAVIHPPVDLARFTASNARGRDYLVVGRLVGYKNVGPIIEAMNQLGRGLVVIGDGPERRRLQRLAGPGVPGAPGGPAVVFKGELDDAGVAEHLGRCRALLFAAEEDFGLVPVEALASGAPVIGLGRGGLLETVTPGRSGVFFDQPTPEAIAAAVVHFEKEPPALGGLQLAELAQPFGRERFNAAVGELVAEQWRGHRENRP